MFDGSTCQKRMRITFSSKVRSVSSLHFRSMLTGLLFERISSIMMVSLKGVPFFSANHCNEVFYKPPALSYNTVLHPRQPAYKVSSKFD